MPASGQDNCKAYGEARSLAVRTRARILLEAMVGKQNGHSPCDRLGIDSRRLGFVPFAEPLVVTPIASNWGHIDGTVILTFWITGAGYVAIILFMAYCILRFRHRAGRRAQYQPENNKLEWALAI